MSTRARLLPLPSRFLWYSTKEKCASRLLKPNSPGNERVICRHLIPKSARTKQICSTRAQQAQSPRRHWAFFSVISTFSYILAMLSSPTNLLLQAWTPIRLATRSVASSVHKVGSFDAAPPSFRSVTLRLPSLYPWGPERATQPLHGPSCSAADVPSQPGRNRLLFSIRQCLTVRVVFKLSRSQQSVQVRRLRSIASHIRVIAMIMSNLPLHPADERQK